jgi:hypothetical protein
MSDADWLEMLWNNILSEDPPRIVAMWDELDVEDQTAIWAHLVKMTTEDGWADVQRESAQAAITAIQAAGKSPS